LGDPATRDFIADALTHRKFIAYSDAACGLLYPHANASHGVQMVALEKADALSTFIERCRKLRNWPTENAKSAEAAEAKE